MSHRNRSLGCALYCPRVELYSLMITEFSQDGKSVETYQACFFLFFILHFFFYLADRIILRLNLFLITLALLETLSNIPLHSPEGI